MRTRSILNQCFFLMSLSCTLCATVEEAPLLNRSTLGLSYDIAFAPSVSRIVGGKTSSLAQLHRASLEVMYPYYRNLALGVSFDYTLADSPKMTNPLLNFSKESARLKSTFLGVSGHIRPQLPFAFKSWDLILYAEGQFGIGTSTPIAFGTEALSDYEYANATKIPTPFPIMFESTPKLGLQIFAWRFIGVDVAMGYRMMWIMHPMVSLPAKSLQPNMVEETRSVIFYDVSSLFIQAGLKFAF